MMPACLLLIAGCSGTASTQYYVLGSIKPSGQSAQLAAIPDMVIQVDIPPYLNRPDMVYRQSDNQLHIDEYHQWGGHLRDNIANTLAQNLSARLTSGHISVAPALHVSEKTWMLYVRIRAFERMPDGRVHLSVYWQLMTDGNTMDARSEDFIGAHVLADHDYDSMAADMSMLLAQFSDHIADVVRAHTSS